LEALFGRQFSWWKVIFFLSSFLLVLLVDCYMAHCPSFASLPSFLHVSHSALSFSTELNLQFCQVWGGARGTDVDT
jgi:hypothetical protein